MKLKVLFLGTPKISVSALKSIFENKNFEIVSVITNADQPFGRNHSDLKESEVAVFAKENGLKVIKTNSINNDFELIKNLEVDYLITCAFGQFLNENVLKLPKKLSLNIHASLLPKGRGGAPIHWSIINNETETGISLMEMVKEMDAGDFFHQEKITIEKNETYDSLYEKLSKSIYDNTSKWIFDLNEGKLLRKKQDESKVTKWLNIQKTDSRINWKKSAIEIECLVRGLYSKPISWTEYENQNIKISEVEIPNGPMMIQMKVYQPGEIVQVTKENGILVSCGEGYLFIKKIIIPGKKEMLVSDVLNGQHTFKKGMIFI